MLVFFFIGAGMVFDSFNDFLVITAEFINSAIEKTVDYISLERHPQAKAIKDLSAAAVLLISICAFCIAVIILGGKLL